MAPVHALPRLRPVPARSVEELSRILARPLPDLPAGDVPVVAAELRRMRSERAATVWRHQRWADLVGWIVRQVPDSDPTIAAVHAIRNRARAIDDPAYARSLAAYVRRIALNSTQEFRSPKRPLEELTWDPPEPPSDTATHSSESLAVEASRLMKDAGATPTDQAWSLIAAGIDIGIDWWAGLATRSGLTGDELVAAARQARKTTVNQRLGQHFDGPSARPLVALLVGGDQRGRWARQVAGAEAGLLYWSLLIRHTCGRGETSPVPPASVVRAWATNLAWIERAIAPSISPGAPAAPASGPTIAA